MGKRTMYMGLAGGSVLLGIGAIATIFLTTPSRLGPVGVTIWFLALCGGLTGLLTAGILGTKQLIKPTDEPMGRLSNSARQGALLAGWVTVNLALSSLAQLTIRDVLLSLILLALIEVYFNLQ